uniref:Prolactin releasing hormone 2 n=1 Tax=Amphiprion ocellaris TaxID=80972 RepID=A0AAQ5X6X4_AMPOC
YVCIFACLLCLFFLLNFEHLVPPYNPDIDASWYTGRGIRPVGRFGRKVPRRYKRLGFITARVYRPRAGSNVWIPQ